jgi:predicted permease
MFLISLWRNVVHRRHVEAELDDEIRAVQDMLAAERVREGATAGAARRAAALEVGGIEQVKERVRDVRAGTLIDCLIKDIVYGFRMLRRDVTFSIVAVTTFALGIGANVFVFSVVETLLLRPVDLTQSTALVMVQAGRGWSTSYPNYVDLRDRTRSFAALAAYRLDPAAVGDGKSLPTVAWGDLATGNYFQTVGVEPALGRFFTPAEDRQAGESPYVVLGYRFWQRRFASDTSIVGRAIDINGRPYAVLGVAPSAFHGTERLFDPDFWVPMTMEGAIEGHSYLDNRGAANITVIGRLRPGISEGQALADVNTVATQLAHEYPTWDAGMRLKFATPGWFGDAGRAPLMAFAGSVMLLACLVLATAAVNLGGLLAARLTTRMREISIRLCIGAQRARVARQFFIETAQVAVMGGVAGVAVAILLLRSLGAWRPSFLPFAINLDVMPDARVVLFALAITTIAAVLAVMPSLTRIWRHHPLEVWRKDKRAPRRWTTSQILLCAELALCCVLVSASFVSIRGLSRALSLRTGIDGSDIHVTGIDLGLIGYATGAGMAMQDDLLRDIAHVPGVEAVSSIDALPLTLDQNTTAVFPNRQTDRRGVGSIQANLFRVSPGFFRLTGARLLRGREFTQFDTGTSPRVAIVNETFAKQVVGTVDGVGQRFTMGRTSIEIVGVTEDGKYATLSEAPRPAMYWPASQVYDSEMMLLVRSHRPESEIAADIRQAIERRDPRIPMIMEGTLSDFLGYALLPARAAAIALGVFGVLALVLSLIGVYGLSSHAVTSRMRDIGIRVAVGATPSQLLAATLGGTVAVLATGAAIGVLISLAASRILESVVYHANTREPLISVSTVIAMIVVGLIATWIPSRFALTMRPMDIFRAE